MFPKLVQITAHFAGVKTHDDTIDAFRDLVTREASVFATADWARRHPEIYSLVAEYLVFHTAVTVSVARVRSRFARDRFP